MQIHPHNVDIFIKGKGNDMNEDDGCVDTLTNYREIPFGYVVRSVLFNLSLSQM